MGTSVHNGRVIRHFRPKFGTPRPPTVIASESSSPRRTELAGSVAVPEWFPQVLPALLDRQPLAPDTLRRVMDDVLAGRCPETDIAVFLAALRVKGETAEELAAAAGVMRERMVPLVTGRDDVLDTCGTGGDGAGTFNLSTAAAFVAAAAGVPVVKHGNKAASSRSGSSADVLRELGVPMACDPDVARRSLERFGLVFCFAPHFHPALGRLADLRRRLGVRTLFDLLGPLANPAKAAYQLLGVGRPELLDPMAGALARLGVRRAFLVCGDDGLDEVSLAGPTAVREVHDGRVSALRWTPDDFGLNGCDPADLRVPDPGASAAAIRAVFAGKPGPARRVVVANAAVALLAAGRAADLRDGVRQAESVIDSGQVAQLLERLQAAG